LKPEKELTSELEVERSRQKPTKKRLMEEEEAQSVIKWVDYKRYHVS